MEEMIIFAKWCMDNKIYIYDHASDAWFHKKTFRQYTWNEIYELFKKQQNKLITK